MLKKHTKEKKKLDLLFWKTGNKVTIDHSKHAKKAGNVTNFILRSGTKKLGSRSLPNELPFSPPLFLLLTPSLNLYH